MPTPRIALTHESEFCEFEYEQCPAGREQGIVKFDHAPRQDGLWRQLNARSAAYDRYVEDYFQLVIPSDERAAVDGILLLIERAGPLRTDDELEITVRAKDEGFEMTSQWIFLSDGAVFDDFTPQSWNAAYERLCELGG